EKSKSLEGRFWYSENWDNRLFQRDIHNEIQATKGISSGCYLQGIELWESKCDTVNNGSCQGCQGSKRGILVEQKGHGATNEMTTKIKLDGLLHLFKTLGICQKVRSISGLLIMEEHILMAPNRRFPHSHEISSYLNESTVIGMDWVMVMEHI
ncbi:hypothetical protein HID58_068630, partial [Brassica napus]